MTQHNEIDDLDFMREMQDVRPLKQDDKVFSNKAEHTLAQQLKREALEKSIRQEGNFLSIEKVDPVDPHDFLTYKKDGVQDGVYKKLRLGQYQIDNVLNLAQHNIEQARSAVFDTIKENHKQGIRTLLIRHGLGLHSKPFPALMKSYVNQWLPQLEEVLAYHSALKHHGGVAAVYVLLKKNKQEKQANRERHRSK